MFRVALLIATELDAASTLELLNGTIGAPAGHS